ncbi:hypothetical protein CPB83DRAFT_116572 [Crepidotus variabilis]|uniref:Uncharacterized protein n=1 Tax=Crepidotus variabilis TaxID=179855 RepID=A0A9P6JIP9_9AGAR|nr:hypothetical protein CPB83DRAFT_116572 [Crepidotus variabilis]
MLLCVHCLTFKFPKHSKLHFALILFQTCGPHIFGCVLMIGINRMKMQQEIDV